MRTLIATALVVALAALPAQAAAPTADDRTADEILTAIDEVAFPTYDAARRDEEGYMDAFFAQRAEATEAVNALALELWEVDPDNEALLKLLPNRWSDMAYDDEQRSMALAEIDHVLAHHRSGEMASMALYQKASVMMNSGDTAGMKAAVRAFRDAYPDDEMGARLLSTLAGRLEGADSVAVWKEVIEAFPDSPSTKYAPGKVRQLEELGKPFALEFTDAVSGDRITMADLRGKVVVVDYWATWCGPCIAEMPHMKELYAEFAPQGVEFVGISLDSPPEDGGLDKLKAYVADNEIPWPQYYQGAGWAGEFSVSWGINAIPALFVVDAQGNLVSTSARGQLETLLPELLAARE